MTSTLPGQEWRCSERLLVDYLESHGIEVRYCCGRPVIDAVGFRQTLSLDAYDGDGEPISTDGLITISVTGLAEYLAREPAEVR